MRVFELICPLQVAADLEIQQVELFAKALSLVEEKQFQEAVPLLNEYQQYRPGDLYTLVPNLLLQLFFFNLFQFPNSYCFLKGTSQLV